MEREDSYQAITLPMLQVDDASLPPPALQPLGDAQLACASHAMPSLEELHNAAPASGYQPESLVIRLSIKLFSCTPAELPPDLKHQLLGWLNSTPAGAEGYIRPGCVQLVIQARRDLSSASALDSAINSEVTCT